MTEKATADTKKGSSPGNCPAGCCFTEGSMQLYDCRHFMPSCGCLSCIRSGTHLHAELHYDRFVFEGAGEDLHFAAGVLHPPAHTGVVVRCGLHVVLCAVGRDQPHRSCALPDCLAEFPCVIFCPGCHGLFPPFSDFHDGLY